MPPSPPTAYRLFFGSAAIAGAAMLDFLSAGTSGGAFTVAAVTGIGSNFLHQCSDSLAERLSASSRGSADLLKNHDLRRLVATTLAAKLQAMAEQSAIDPATRKRLRVLALKASDGWLALADHEALEGLDEATVPRFFSMPESTFESAVALSDEVWGNFLAYLERAISDESIGDAFRRALKQDITSFGSSQLSTTALAAVAAELTESMPQALYEAAKHAFANDPAAYAALQLRLMRELMTDVRDILATVLNTSGKVDALLTKQVDAEKQLRAIADAVNAAAPATAKHAAKANAADVRKILDEIIAAHEDVTKQLARIEGHTRIAADRATRAAASGERLEVGQADTNAMLAQMLPMLSKVAAAVAAQSAAKPPPTRTAVGITNIPAPEPHWIHRREITRGIRAMLNSGDGTASLTAAVATAAGGYGKTFAARIYAFEHAGDYPGGRFEIKIDTSTMEAQLATLLPLLAPGENREPKEAAPIVHDMLSKPPASLLIIDNVPSLNEWQKHVASGLVPGGACHVLLTTQKKDILPQRTVKVRRFTTEEAWTVLARARPESLDTEHVAWVGRALRAADGLPVIVAAIAARMLVTAGVSWEDYWASLVGRYPTLFGDSALPALIRAPDAPADPNQAARHHALLDDCFATLPPALQRALEYTALMPPDMMPKVWLTSLMDEDELVVPPATGSSVVADLLSMQLLTPADAAGNLLSLHRLWHARVNERAKAESDGKRQSLAACVVALLAPVFLEATRTQDYRHADPLAAQAKILLDLIDPTGVASPADDLTASLSDYLVYHGDISTGEQLARRVLTREARLDERHHVALAQAYYSLGFVEASRSRFEEADAAYERGLRCMARSGYVGHFIEVACAIGKYFAAEDRGAYQESVAAARTAVRIARSGKPVDAAAVGDTLANLAYALSNVGRYHGDTKAAQESLLVSKQQLKERQDDLQTWLVSAPYAYRNLAWVLNAQGQHAAAEKLVRQSLDSLNSNEHTLRYALHNANSILGEAMAGQGRFAEAETLLHAAAEQLSTMSEAGANAIRESLARLVRMYNKWHALSADPIHASQREACLAKLVAFDKKVGFLRPGEV